MSPTISLGFVYSLACAKVCIARKTIAGIWAHGCDIDKYCVQMSGGRRACFLRSVEVVSQNNACRYSVMGAPVSYPFSKLFIS